MKVEKRGSFFKVDDTAGIAYGWAIVCTENGKPYVDLQGDHIPEDVMTKALAEFAKGSRIGKDQHVGEQTGEHVFLYPLTKGSTAGLGITSTKTGAIVGYQPANPADLEKIKTGERTGFSIGGVLEEADGELGKAIAKAATGEPGKARVFRAFKIHEISLVDVPAQEGATVGYVKRAPSKRVVARLHKSAVLTSETDGHQHVLDLDDPACGWSDVLQTSYQTAAGAAQGHSHAWTYDAATGAITIAADSGHSHTVSAVVSQETIAAAALQEEAEAQRALTDPLVESVCTDDKPAGATTIVITASAKSTRKAAAAQPALTSPEPTMTTEELAAENADLKQKLADLQAQLDASATKAELTDAQKAHFKSLDPRDAKAFLAKSASERQAVIAEIEKANEVVYTCEDGTTVRKSDGAMALRFAKQTDEAMKIAKAERDARELTELTKRADATLGALAGSDKIHVALLKAAEGIADEATRKSAIETLKSANAAMAAKSVAKGVGGEAVPAEDGPQAELDAMVAKHAADHKVDERTARLAVVQVGKGRELYNQIELQKKRG